MLGVLKNRDKNKHYSLQLEIGLALILIGMPLGTAIRNVLPNLELVNFIMFLSFLLVIDYKNLINLKLPFLSFWFIILIIFQIIEILYATIEKVNDFYFYHIYLILILIGLSTQSRTKTFYSFLRIIFYFSGFISFVVFYQATLGLTQLIGGGYVGTGRLWLVEGGDPINMARALLVNIIVVMVYKGNSPFEKIMRYVFLVTSIIGLLGFGTRSSIVVSIIVFTLFLWNKQILKITTTKDFFRIVSYVFLITLVLIFLYLKNDFFSQKVDYIIEAVERGVATYFLGNSNLGVDGSTIVRYRTFNKALEIMRNDFEFHNFVFGNGYMGFYIDIPLIQVFFDLGIFGFIYFIFTIVFPFKSNVFKTRFNDVYLFIKLFCVQILFDQFFTGLPYYYTQFVPIIILLFVSKRRLLNQKKTEFNLK
ncbi:hypothetical protein SAMN05444411_101775 [Lutibacter oricola]|uniref:O-Antigen ligase n=1 Tax=Lutibacter oricola TaxID=762486 RepID=A0A1H2TQ49_9FLAO|nr:hypothetical protein [Lutibacter oricola]SDW45991.1 hypothetical protein SAMN05444411_101775 [Lutibacter oricola]